MTIGQRIKERRRELKISADELAKRLGKSRATIYRYENGDVSGLPIDTLAPLAAELKTTPEYLMGWDEVQKNNDVIADIIVRMRTDSVFFEVLETVNELDEEKLLSVKYMLTAFLK